MHSRSVAPPHFTAFPGDPLLYIRAAAATANANLMPEHAKAQASVTSTVMAMSADDRELMQWARHPMTQSLYDIVEQRRAEFERLNAPPPWTPSYTLVGSVTLLVLLAIVGGGSGGRKIRAAMVFTMSISGLAMLFTSKLAVDKFMEGSVQVSPLRAQGRAGSAGVRAGGVQG